MTEDERETDSPGRSTDEQGLGFEETKAALDGLLEASLVVWEAGGEDHLWRISPGGRDFLASARA